MPPIDSIHRFQRTAALRFDASLAPQRLQPQLQTRAQTTPVARPATPSPQLAQLRDGFDAAPTRSNAVSEIQKKLGMQNPDGIFGPKTQAAVERFQRAKGLEDDGIVGPQTWGALFNQRMPQNLGTFRAGARDEFVGGPGGVTGTREPQRTGGVHAGGGWGGTERLADEAKRIARDLGVPVTSTKRTKTGSIGSTSHSDHHVSQKNAYAVDLGVSGRRGDDLARRIADAYGIRGPVAGSYKKHLINVDGQMYRMQLLWKVPGHYDHVHVGFRKV